MAAECHGRAPPLLGRPRTPCHGGTGSGQHPGQAWPCRSPQPQRRSRCSLAAGSRWRWRWGEQHEGRRGSPGDRGHRWAGLPGRGAGWPGPLAPPSAGPGHSLAVPGGRGIAGATCTRRHGHSLTPARLTLPRFCLEIGHKEPPGGWLPAGRWRGTRCVLCHRGVTRRGRGCRRGSGSWPGTARRSPSASAPAAGTDVHGTCVCVCARADPVSGTSTAAAAPATWCEAAPRCRRHHPRGAGSWALGAPAPHTVPPPGVLGLCCRRGRPGMDGLRGTQPPRPRKGWRRRCLTSRLAQRAAAVPASPPAPVAPAAGLGARSPCGAAPTARGVGPGLGPLIASADQAGRLGPVPGMRLRHWREPPSRLAHRR